MTTHSTATSGGAAGVPPRKALTQRSIPCTSTPARAKQRVSLCACVALGQAKRRRRTIGSTTGMATQSGAAEASGGAFRRRRRRAVVARLDEERRGFIGRPTPLMHAKEGTYEAYRQYCQGLKCPLV